MTPTNLWGELDSLVPERTPTTVLKEQAIALADMTHSLLTGRVTVTARRDRFYIALSVIAPAVNNYECEIVRVSHGIIFYPATVAASSDLFGHPLQIECKNEAALTTALATIFQSDEVRKVISSLITQSKEM